MDGLESLKKAQAIMKIALLVGVIALLMSVVKNYTTEYWLKQKSSVACVPADVENSQPIVYHQTALNNVQNDAYIKSFIEEYVHLTQDEQIVDYHSLSSHQRYDKAKLSQAKWKAIEMSVNDEKALNMERYADSSDVFHTLEQGQMGWVFLIDDILLFPAATSGAIVAVVRGEFQVTFDKVKVDLPPRLWGYREIHLIIQQGIPVDNSKDEHINKYGLFVAWSNINILTPEQKETRSDRNYDYYLMKENN